MAYEIPSIILGASWKGDAAKTGVADLTREVRGAEKEAKSFRTDVASIGREATLSGAAMSLFGAVTFGSLIKIASVGPITSAALAQMSYEGTRLGLTLDQTLGPALQGIMNLMNSFNNMVESKGLQTEVGGGMIGLAGGVAAAGFLMLIKKAALAIPALGIIAGGGGVMGAMGDPSKSMEKYASLIGSSTILGAGIGSVVPGIGTGVGAGIGFVGGGVYSLLDYYGITGNSQGNGQTQVPRVNSVTIMANNVTMASGMPTR